MEWVTYLSLFAIGTVLVTLLFYVALNPRSVTVEGETADIRFIGFMLMMIILTAATVASMLVLGRVSL